MTGHIEAINSERADQVKADSYVVKTSDYAMLIQALKKLFY